MIDAALALINRNGWKIFCCAADKSKKPLCKGSWKKKNNHIKPDHDLLQQARKGKRLVAAVTPPDVFVVDIDNKAAIKPLNKTLKQNLLKTTLVVESGRGYHLYYRLPKKLELRRLKGKVDLFADIDLRQNGYMIIPPSLHYLKKHHYTQVSNGFDTPQKPPKAFVKLLRKCYRQIVSDKDYLTEKDLAQMSDGEDGQAYITNTQLETALDALSPSHYTSLEDFFRLTASVHHATGGNNEAREIFIEWARNDSVYNDKESILNNRRIWDNCK